MIHDPYSVTPRKPLTSKQLLQLFIAEKGICCLCDTKINSVREAWDEHINPLWRDGTNEITNRGVAHVSCAKAKTSGEATARAKGRKASEHHFGASRAKTKPMPFGRRSMWKKKLSGEVVPR